MGTPARRVAIIGFGAIGSRVAEHTSRSGDRTALISVLVRSLRRVPSDAREELGPILTEDWDNLDSARPDVVVEAAGTGAVRAYGPAALEAGADLVVVSVGALADDNLRARLEEAASKGGARLFVPAGAVGGLDVLKAASLAGLDSVTHTIRKPPEALLDEREAAEVRSGNEPLQVFVGSARRSAAAFPQNTNSTVTVGLAGVGLDNTAVRIVADPGVSRNTHEISARGVFGEFSISVSNFPFASNPKSSQLTALSVVSLLEARTATLIVGN